MDRYQKVFTKGAKMAGIQRKGGVIGEGTLSGLLQPFL
jgi:hypothetical protein